MWPFLDEVPGSAKKASKNRAKGTNELKTVNIAKEVYRNLLIYPKVPAMPEHTTQLKFKRTMLVHALILKMHSSFWKPLEMCTT